MEEKIEKVILESYDSLYRLAYCYVRDENDAMEIVQESVYKAIRGEKPGKGGAVYQDMAL